MKREPDLAVYFDQYPAHRILLEDRNKIRIMTMMPGNEMFIKIFKYPDLIASRFQHRRFAGGGLEFANCMKLRALGIATPEPIGSAVKRNRIGFAVQSLYAAKWLKGSQVFSKYIAAEKYAENRGTGNKEYEALFPLCEQLGAFLGDMNSKGVVSTDFNANNVLVTQKDSHEKFFLVDYERIFFKRKVSLKSSILGLSHIGAYLAGLDPGLIKPFCKGYDRINPVADQNEFFRIVQSASLAKKAQWENRIEDQFHRMALNLASENKGTKR